MGRTVTCGKCNQHFPEEQLISVNVREDYGDVACAKCPKCGAIEYDYEYPMFVYVSKVKPVK